ncbi:MAG: protein ral secretion pathway protein [Candidatus Parcubacteria bacterium]|jgi:prepilin-type N-terminal cleavage/methylation domain-containing protein
MQQRGFTLIELLVVIGIIALLAAIVLAFLSDGREKSRDSARAADLKQLQIALSLYFDATGAYPPDLSVLVPKYISVIPKDPASNAVYPYDRLSDTDYHLGASLEQANITLLKSDVDATSTNILGTDSAGCAGGVGWHCYDVRP